MDDQQVVVGEIEQHDLEEVAREIRSDDEHLRWIGIGFEVEDAQAVGERVADVRLGDAVAERRTVDIHTPES